MCGACEPDPSPRPTRLTTKGLDTAQVYNHSCRHSATIAAESLKFKGATPRQARRASKTPSHSGEQSALTVNSTAN